MIWINAQISGPALAGFDTFGCYVEIHGTYQAGYGDK